MELIFENLKFQINLVRLSWICMQNMTDALKKSYPITDFILKSWTALLLLCCAFHDMVDPDSINSGALMDEEAIADIFRIAHSQLGEISLCTADGGQMICFL
jgi:hypothetical protein